MDKLPVKPIKIVGISNQDNAVGYLRINQPLRFIAKQKLAKIHTIPFFGKSAEYLTSPEFSEYFALEGEWADVVYSTIGNTRYYLSLLLAMKEQYGVKLVIDIDDDPTAVHLDPANPAYMAYLDPTSRHAEYAQMSLQLADMVTVSTPYLYERFKNVNKNVVLIQNSIDTKIFRKQAKNKGNKITLGYAGSGSHQKDLEYISPVIKDIKKKYPNVKLKSIGPCNIPEIDERLTWAGFLEYPKALKAFQFDIGLAPIKDNQLARGKSALRFMEYTSLGIPTIGSNVVPFGETTNMLKCNTREEWYNSIESLILDKNKRTELAEKAYDELLSTANPLDWSRKLYNSIETIVHGDTL